MLLVHITTACQPLASGHQLDASWDTHTRAHTHTHTHTHIHTQAAWHKCRGARLCLHGTKVALSCQRLTFALRFRPNAHPPLCCDGATHATSTLKYACSGASAMAGAAIAGAGVRNSLAPPCLHSFTSAPSPLAIIRGLFAPPRIQQCRKMELSWPLYPLLQSLHRWPFLAPHAAAEGSAQLNTTQGSSSVSASACRFPHCLPTLLKALPSHCLLACPHPSCPSHHTTPRLALPLLACAPCLCLLAMLAHLAAACLPCLRTLPQLARHACAPCRCLLGPRLPALQTYAFLRAPDHVQSRAQNRLTLLVYSQSAARPEGPCAPSPSAHALTLLGRLCKTFLA